MHLPAISTTIRCSKRYSCTQVSTRRFVQATESTSAPCQTTDTTPQQPCTQDHMSTCQGHQTYPRCHETPTPIKAAMRALDKPPAKQAMTTHKSKQSMLLVASPAPGVARATNLPQQGPGVLPHPREKHRGCWCPARDIKVKQGKSRGVCVCVCVCVFWRGYGS